MKVRATPTVDSLVSADHTSEGVMFMKSDGNIIQFFRLSAGASGDHTDVNGKIMKREFNTTTQEWGAASDFYNSIYDDRNPHGGVTSTGRMVLFIYRHVYATLTIVDCLYMYSDDDGDTWSDPVAIDSSLTDPVSFGNIIYIPTKGYMTGFFDEATSYRVSVQFSSDGSEWGSEVVVGDYTSGHEYNLSETCFAYIGDGKIIAISRDQNSETSGSNFYQITSDDYGETWSVPQKTNIGTPYFMPAPTIFVHGDRVFVMGADRRDSSNEEPVKDEGLWFYSGDPSVVFSSAISYKQEFYRPRPLSTSTMNLYGYQDIIKLTETRYLVVFTDRYNDGTNEDANLYQFYLDIEGPVKGSSYAIPVFELDSV